ncbi:MAG TPA: UDP-N-acetylmuramoyl-L-alanine--D-glutamate ligase, partial [Spirochaetia bacterium]|nr:UDP-N-acetylmuramoyl-L-alanine--D-glutamate ligase [Spirochaetia bacterium]
LLEEQEIPNAGPFDSLESALGRAMDESKAGDVVLLSPGCASFEMFRNEFDRGDSFVRAVRALQANAGS